MYHIQMFNLSRSKVFALPSEYSDWTEACMEGQKYIFNRQEENNEALFFRVVDNCDFIPEEEEEEETKLYNEVGSACPEDQENCFLCPKFSQCWEEEEEEEEPSSDSLAEILSEFNAIRPNY